MYLNPVVNGNWPEVIIQRTTLRDQLENRTEPRLPKFTDAEIARIKGTTDFLAINHYLSNIVSNDKESTDGKLSYDNDVRAVVGVDPNWQFAHNRYPVSKIL